MLQRNWGDGPRDGLSEFDLLHSHIAAMEDRNPPPPWCTCGMGKCKYWPGRSTILDPDGA